MRRYLLFFAVLGLCAPWVHADLRASMSEAEFEAAGLDKLTAAELAALQAWIDKRSARPPQSGPVVVESVPEQPPTPAVAARTPALPVPGSREPAALSAPPAASSGESRFGEEQLVRKVDTTEVPERITARIKGEFRGWDGKTVFYLDNGQVWRQRIDGRYRGPKRTDPEVVIEKGRFGYHLRLVESKRSVGVKRIR